MATNTSDATVSPEQVLTAALGMVGTPDQYDGRAHYDMVVTDAIIAAHRAFRTRPGPVGLEKATPLEFARALSNSKTLFGVVTSLEKSQTNKRVSIEFTPLVKGVPKPGQYPDRATTPPLWSDHGCRLRDTLRTIKPGNKVAVTFYEESGQDSAGKAFKMRVMIDIVDFGPWEASQ